MKKIPIPVIATSEEFIPTYGSQGAAGADVRAALKEPLTLLPGETALVPTGIKMEIPPGFEVQVRPRSGLALKHSVTVLNTPGTIDSDYRGEVGIILINHSNAPFIVTPGMRIAQLVVAECVTADFFIREELTLTSRGSGGFGHTGFN